MWSNRSDIAVIYGEKAVFYGTEKKGEHENEFDGDEWVFGDAASSAGSGGEDL